MIQKPKITTRIELSCNICSEGEFVYELPLAKLPTNKLYSPLNCYLLSLLDDAKFQATRAGWDIPEIVHEWICPSCQDTA